MISTTSTKTGVEHGDQTHRPYRHLRSSGALQVCVVCLCSVACAVCCGLWIMGWVVCCGFVRAPLANIFSFGFGSAARVWHTFKVFGARDVSILDGGLPAWKYEVGLTDGGERRCRGCCCCWGGRSNNLILTRTQNPETTLEGRRI